MEQLNPKTEVLNPKTEVLLTKRCKTCAQDKPLTDFWYNPKTKDKLKTSCVDCCKEYNKQHYEKNKKERIKQIIEWQKKKRREVPVRQLGRKPRN